LELLTERSSRRIVVIVGVPKEVKADEYRVSMVPAGVEELSRAGHRVLVQKGAGEGSGISDEEYRSNGATIVDTAEEIFGQAELVVKVKEPQEEEWPLLRSEQILFTYFHFAADRVLTNEVLKTGVTAVAYETLRGPNNTLPCLTPMSEIAGRMRPNFLNAHSKGVEFFWEGSPESNRPT
jgi:alanine dehydrogenase